MRLFHIAGNFPSVNCRAFFSWCKLFARPQAECCAIDVQGNKIIGAVRALASKGSYAYVGLRASCFRAAFFAY